MRLRYTAMPAWPPLAWLARLMPGDTVDVFHGADVAIAQDWFSEAVWDGSYALGDLDHTDVVFGSGGRLRWGLLGSSVTFVSSASTVDRLQSMTACGATWVSNSLVCLLATLGASVDPAYPAYFRDFKSIAAGLARYTRTLETSAGPVRFTYYDNLAWDGQSLREVTKPRPARSFTSFPRYRAFLESALARLMENASDPGRSFGFDPLGTISSGYDSATVAALARPAGGGGGACARQSHSIAPERASTTAGRRSRRRSISGSPSSSAMPGARPRSPRSRFSPPTPRVRTCTSAVRRSG